MVPSGPADCLFDIRVTNTTKEAALRICTAIPDLGQPLAHQRPIWSFLKVKLPIHKLGIFHDVEFLRYEAVNAH